MCEKFKCSEQSYQVITLTGWSIKVLGNSLALQIAKVVKRVNLALLQVFVYRLFEFLKRNETLLKLQEGSTHAPLCELNIRVE